LIQKGLQDQRRSHLINNAAVVLTCVPGFVQDLVGLAAGEALIPQMDWQTGKGA
jgi:hypothetical protein